MICCVVKYNFNLCCVKYGWYLIWLIIGLIDICVNKVFKCLGLKLLIFIFLILLFLYKFFIFFYVLIIMVLFVFG